VLWCNVKHLKGRKLKNIRRLDMRNKAQTAMEYLMTYGWAILIIIVVVAALYSLGVFSVGTSIACSPCFSYFAYRDYDSTIGLERVHIRNGPRSLSALSCALGCTAVDVTCAVATPCDPGIDIQLTVPAGVVNIELSYTDADTTVIHSDTAKITP